MKEGHKHAVNSHSRSRHSSEPAFQVICLASGGGPSEDSVTGFLVRSVSTNWAKNSVLAVDAGSHLASITRLLEPYFPRVSEVRFRDRSAHDWNASAPVSGEATPETSDESDCSSEASQHHTVLDSGPFAGLAFPHDSARANAVWIVRQCVSTYLITHPHLDHLSGFVINTAAFHNTSRPKKLAALSSTVNAVKTHLFNDVIWPNLTDEDGGVGLVTFQRLAAGGNIAIGEGSGKGYMEICNSLCVKGLKISHGHCTRGPDAVPKRGSDVGLSEPMVRRTSGTATAIEGTDQRKMSASHLALSPDTQHTQHNQHSDTGHHEVVVDSTAYFIRDDATGREILCFGDVEPDALSLNPRTFQVWTEAAPKIASGQLKAILIECSYDDSQADNVLFGHLAPRHLINELQILADLVRTRKEEDALRRRHKKRKLGRTGEADLSTAPPTDDEGSNRSKRRPNKNAMPGLTSGSSNTTLREEEHGGLSPRSVPVGSQEHHTDHVASPSAPLAGVSIVVIHIKDTLEDGPVVGDRILRQLRHHEARLQDKDGHGLGCDFVISEPGGSYWF